MKVVEGPLFAKLPGTHIAEMCGKEFWPDRACKPLEALSHAVHECARGGLQWEEEVIPFPIPGPCGLTPINWAMYTDILAVTVQLAVQVKELSAKLDAISAKM